MGAVLESTAQRPARTPEPYPAVMTRPRSPYALDDPAEILRIVRETPWATFVSQTSTGLRMTQYPVLLDQAGGRFILRSHFCGPDITEFELGRHELLAIVHGPNGYISPSWYPEGQAIPTWDFVTVQLRGVPEIVSADENFAVLQRMVDQFEAPVEQPRTLEGTDANRRVAALGTTGIRMPVTAWTARAKLSQNKQPTVLQRIRAELGGDGPYANPRLVREMARVSGESGAPAAD